MAVDDHASLSHVVLCISSQFRYSYYIILVFLFLPSSVTPAFMTYPRNIVVVSYHFSFCCSGTSLRTHLFVFLTDDHFFYLFPKPHLCFFEFLFHLFVSSPSFIVILGTVILFIIFRDDLLCIFIS